MRSGKLFFAVIGLLGSAACGQSIDNVGDPFGAILNIQVSTSDAGTAATFTSLVVVCEPQEATFNDIAIVSRYKLADTPLPLKGECASGIGDNPAQTWKVTAFLSKSATPPSLNSEIQPPTPDSGAPNASLTVDWGNCSVGCSKSLSMSL